MKNNKQTIKWCTLDNADATATLKQHGYVKKQMGIPYPYDGKTYEGNAQLCNEKGFCSEDGESAMKWANIKHFSKEPHAGACKKCLKIYNAQKEAQARQLFIDYKAGRVTLTEALNTMLKIKL